MTSFTFASTGRGESGGEYELLEPGWYSFEVVNAYDTDRDGATLETRAGVEYFKLVCAELANGVNVWHYLFCDPESPGRLSAFLVAIGYEFKPGETVELNAATFVGHIFRGRIENKPGNAGVMRNHIPRVQRVATPEPVEPVQEEATPEPETETPNAQVAGDDDEVPF